MNVKRAKQHKKAPTVVRRVQEKSSAYSLVVKSLHCVSGCKFTTIF